MSGGDVRPASCGDGFAVVDGDKASVSYSQPAGRFVRWSGGVRREQWTGVDADQ